MMIQKLNDFVNTVLLQSIYKYQIINIFEPALIFLTQKDRE